VRVFRWVLIDLTGGVQTRDHSAISPAALEHVAEAVAAQVNGEFAEHWGARASIRVGAGADDIEAGEWAFILRGALPEAPDASAYHEIRKGVPYAICAVSTCGSLCGPNGVSVDVSHEILETAGDEAANLFANNERGELHALELCDAVELQTYRKACRDGTQVHVSNWLLRAWFVPGAAGPFDYMTSVRLPGAVAPAAPLHTAPGDGGNYQILAKWSGERQVAGARLHIRGTRRKGPELHWSSRAGRRLAQAR